MAVNEALPCGAKAIRTGGAGQFTIIVFELVRRPGADCGPGTGNRARGAIRVAGGRIREWYRLPDAPGAAQPAPPAAGPTVASARCAVACGTAPRSVTAAGEWQGARHTSRRSRGCDVAL